MQRRSFLVQGGAALSAAAFVKADHHGEKAEKREKWPIVAFEKPFQKLSYERIGEELAKLGLDGIEATIRKGGHIEAANAEEEVPRMVADLAKNGQKALIAATHVGEANEANEKFLRILKEHGIERYRMNYFRYDLKGDMLQQLRDYKTKAAELAALNKEIGIQGLYQLHSGARLVGGMSWDLAILLEDIDPKHLGVGFDLRHFRTDSGLSWKAALQTCRKHIQSIYVKDAKWVGERSDKLKACRLDTGFVNQGIFNEVRKGQPVMPISLHMEWGKANVYKKEHAMDAVRRLAIDAETLKSWI